MEQPSLCYINETQFFLLFFFTRFHYKFYFFGDNLQVFHTSFPSP